MTDNLALAQQIAWDLARTLLVPVTLFRCAGRFSVIPTAEFDGEPDQILTEYDPFDRP
jgi:hypothetical protein